jgi:serine/threonine-protein kinase
MSETRPLAGKGEPDPLAAFSVESSDSASAPATESSPGSARSRFLSAKWIVGAGLVVTIVMSAGAVAELGPLRSLTPVETGTLTLESTPPGVKVTIDGDARGVTPLTVSLTPGAHMLGLAHEAETRSVPITIAARRDVSHHFEFSQLAPSVTTGRLTVTVDVPGSRVSIDGRPRGTAPLAAVELTIGEHDVTVSSDAGSVDRKVTIEPGNTSTVAFSLPKASGGGLAAGWLTVAAPFDLDLYEGGDLVGTSAAKIMMATGRHELRVSNRTLAYEESRRVDIVAGKVTSMRIEAPMASLSANARPWADVLIDGNALGQTPLANVSVTVGTHQVIFRHPQLGEQRQTVVVTATGPNRISADMTKK